MAHDNQFKESMTEGMLVQKWDYPKKGEMYWDRVEHRAKEAVRDMGEKCLILVRGN